MGWTGWRSPSMLNLGSPEGDAALTQVALAYARALSTGVVDPTKTYGVYTVPRPLPDLRPGLDQALRSGRLSEWLKNLSPQDPNYRKLSESYVALISKRAAAKAAIPAPAEPIKPGAVDPRIPAIALQLAKYDYLDRPSSGDRYTQPMAAAIRKMQADYGLKPDGGDRRRCDGDPQPVRRRARPRHCRQSGTLALARGQAAGHPYRRQSRRGAAQLLARRQAGRRPQGGRGPA